MSLRGTVVGAERILERLLGTYNNAPAETLDPVLRGLGKQYKIQIITDYSDSDENRFSFSALNKSQLKNAGKLLSSELTLYAPEVIHASKLERLVLCSNLCDKNETLGGLADIGFLVVDTIFINMDRASKVWDHARLTVHHELFHCMDYHDDGYLDFEWRKLNVPGFTYWHKVDKESYDPDEPGFIEEYCRSSEWEDKAVVYSNMIVKYAELLERCQNDKVLLSKVERMKEIVHKISPSFDANFWESMRTRSLHGTAGVALAETESRHEQLADGERITITVQRASGRTMWLVDVDAREQSSHKFYSYNKLRHFLWKKGLSEVPTKEELNRGTYTLSRGAE